MKKLVLFSALFALLAALVFTACKKDEPTAQNTQAAAWANPANPFDIVGQQHNDGLDILRSQADGRPVDMAGDFRLLEEHGFGKADYKSMTADFALLLTSDRPLMVIADKHLNEGNMTRDLHTALGKLNEIVLANGLTAQLNAEARAFEASIPSLGLSADETRALYSAASVARYSNQYWSAVAANDAATGRYKLPPIVGTILKDIAGFIDKGVDKDGNVNWAAGVIGAIEASFLGMAPHGGDGDGHPGDDDQGLFGIHTTSLPIGIPMGGGIFGPPCAPGYACPCTIEFNPDPIGLYYMAGDGFALAQEGIVLDMDASAFSPDFLKSLSSGTFYLDRDFTVPQNVVAELLSAGGFNVPDEPTVWEKGDKTVITVGNSSMLVMPVGYSDGSGAIWYVVLNH